jgi:hypothetical protein
MFFACNLIAPVHDGTKSVGCEASSYLDNRYTITGARSGLEYFSCCSAQASKNISAMDHKFIVTSFLVNGLPK